MNEVAKPVISKILREYIEGGRPHYVMTSDLDSQIYYPDDYLRSNRYISFSGAHALTFPKARKFILAGGHLLFCLCETLRDLILGMPTNVKLELVFLADGIYLPGPNGDGTWGKSNELQRPIKLLSTFLEDFSDDYLIRFVETEMLHENMLCQQNPFPTYTLLPANQITIEIQRDGIPIGTIGQGPRFLIFNFTDSTSI